jgi:hypothetical protein
MTDLTIQKLTADEYHELVDCIQIGHVLNLQEFVEQHPVDNMTTLGQVLLEFFQFHEARMNEHAAMYEALRNLLPAIDASCPESEREKFEKAVAVFDRILPIQIGRQVRHKDMSRVGRIDSVWCGKPAVKWNDSKHVLSSEWHMLEEIEN